MKFFRVVNLRQNVLLAKNARLAETSWGRLRGLLGSSELKPGEGLILRSCTSIHTFFMRFPIDVVFVDRENRIIKIYPCLRPWRLTPIFFSAALCLELPNGTIASTHTQMGDQIEFNPEFALGFW